MREASSTWMGFGMVFLYVLCVGEALRHGPCGSNLQFFLSPSLFPFNLGLPLSTCHGPQSQRQSFRQMWGEKKAEREREREEGGEKVVCDAKSQWRSKFQEQATPTKSASMLHCADPSPRQIHYPSLSAPRGRPLAGDSTRGEIERGRERERGKSEKLWTPPTKSAAVWPVAWLSCPLVCTRAVQGCFHCPAPEHQCYTWEQHVHHFSAYLPHCVLIKLKN